VWSSVSTTCKYPFPTSSALTELRGLVGANTVLGVSRGVWLSPHTEWPEIQHVYLRATFPIPCLLPIPGT